MQILRYLSLNEMQFLGCNSAFVDSIFGALHSAGMYLKKLEGKPKGSAFAFEMHLDQHRYGALLILERWENFVQAFSPHAQLGSYQSIFHEAPSRVKTAENLLGRANQVIDATGQYSEEVVAACLLAFLSVETTFAEERKAAEQSAKLGPMLPDDFRDYRRVFLGDLAAR